MNAANVAMGAAGILASVIASALSSRFGCNELNRNLVARVRVAANGLLGEKELDRFFSNYWALLAALGKLAGTQCLAFLLFTLPMVGIYQLTAHTFDGHATFPTVSSSDWFSTGELIFIAAFMVGSAGVYLRRKM